MAKEEKIKKEKKHFLKNFKSELKKVIWPTTKQLVNNTMAVITIVLLTAVIVFVLDLVFAAINTYGIDKLKTKVESNNTTSIINQIEDSNTTENTQTDVTVE